jgi:hypothetical protein
VCNGCRCHTHTNNNNNSTSKCFEIVSVGEIIEVIFAWDKAPNSGQQNKDINHGRANERVVNHVGSEGSNYICFLFVEKDLFLIDGL